MSNLSRSIGPGKAFLSAACMLFLLAVTTNAYTVVMRGGKRIEIPAQFTVTKTTLTYEAAPSFFITLQMTAVDIRTTELANNETAGSLLARVTEEQQSAGIAQSTSVSRKTKATRSITNLDLESYARARAESDRAYQQKRKELGLPPLEVTRAQAAAETERTWQELERKRAEDEANERAAGLQAQIAALSNRLNYVQASVNDGSYVSAGGFDGWGGIPFYISLGRTRFGRTRLTHSGFGTSFGLPFGQSFGLPFGQSFGLPFGLPIRRPIGSLHSPFGVSPRFQRQPRYIIAPGAPFRGRMGFGSGAVHRHFR